MAEHDIVFEDLHGSPEKDHATVDLDSDNKDKGVTRFDDDDSSDRTATVDLEKSGDEGVDVDVSAPTGRDDKGDGEDDGFSKKVKARIQRATRATKKAKDEAGYWQQQALQAKKDAAELRKRGTEKQVELLDGSIETVEAQLEQAFESGESADQAKLTSRLADLKADKKAAEYELDNWVEPDVGDFSPDSGNIDPAPDNERQKLVAGWMEENDDWYSAKGFERHTRVANRIDKEVFADGFDPGTDEYYEELTNRIKEKFPKLFVDDTEDDDPTDRRSTRRGDNIVAPVDGAESAATKKRTSSSRVELDSDDFANMRRFGLDTNDPAVLREYAANKREADRALR
jgi:hypothetical protein